MLKKKKKEWLKGQDMAQKAEHLKLETKIKNKKIKRLG